MKKIKPSAKKAIVKRSYVGLFIWEVGITYAEIGTYSNKNTFHKHTVLLITTAVKSIALATQKAKTFLAANADQYPKPQMEMVNLKGTIDA